MGKFEALCNEYRENKRLIEDLEAENESIKAQIIDAMGGNDVYTEGAAKASNTLVTSSRFDSSGFKRAYPGLYQEFSRTSSYRRFSVL